MKILLLASAFSGLTQRVERELILLGHDVEKHCECDEPLLTEHLQRFSPDLVICPFLTWRIPDAVWQQFRCLVVHPGIEGDRGPSSLDWAITRGLKRWGVTLLQAAEEMDAGDIWGTRVFAMRRGSKLSIYKREVSSAAVELIKRAVLDAQSADFRPRPLDYSDPGVQGELLPLMRQIDRRISWQEDRTSEVITKINAADTSPGVADSALGGNGERVAVHLYGAVAEPVLRGRPGDLIAVHNEAACYATRDAAVWVRQIKCKDHPSLPPIKLPAARVLGTLVRPGALDGLPRLPQGQVVDEIRVDRDGEVAYLYFDFYNGAASTEQCLALRDRLVAIKNSDAKAIVFMGGEDFWSNGIHLNCIEAAANPADESWRNINAIDDLVREMIECPRQITIAALRNNAGAGGAIMALACDKVIIREGVVLNPHYGNMGLFGSEYWTYLLPKRVGSEMATQIAAACEPMLAAEAIGIGYADLQFAEDWEDFHQSLHHYAANLCRGEFESILEQKVRTRARDEAQRPLADYRAAELAEMRKCFYDPASEYHRARRDFVYKGMPPAEENVSSETSRRATA
jgi:putative two-component system hydrogenase maturation factor HypX/HoxX